MSVEWLKEWLRANWSLSIPIACVYVVLVFTGRHWMSARPRYELRTTLCVWNVMLAIFSIAGTIGVWPEFVASLSNKGVVHATCDNSYLVGTSGFWSVLFVASKLVELVDTLFIVLRKQPLIFLHWYHHATVLVYSWYSYKDTEAASGRWFIALNYLVHSFMYSYYACKSLRIRLPPAIAMAITSMQLAQMLVGCFVNWIAFGALASANKCHNTRVNIAFATLMYASYLLLFANFFWQSYVLKTKTKTTNKKKMMDEDKEKIQHATNGTKKHS